MQSLGLDVKVGARPAQHPEVEPENARGKGVLEQSPPKYSNRIR